MPDLLVRNTKPAIYQYEVRCPSFTAFNNLGAPGPGGKYSLSIQRVSEPQDQQGNQIGERIALPEVQFPELLVAAGERYTLSDGTVLTVAQLLEGVNRFVDAHKGDNLPPLNP
jgi:hypothetical protein